MPPIRIGELQSFSVVAQVLYDGMDILAKNNASQISVKTHDVTMPELAEIQRIYTISKRKKLSEHFQKTSSRHVTF